MLKKAFTLIELLVVIAIIAILAAILFPVFAQAKAAAKQTQNISNLKNLGLAVIMYEGDYDDSFPLSSRYESTDAAFFGLEPWQVSVQPYIKNWGVFLHPLGPTLPSDPAMAAWHEALLYGSPARAANQGLPYYQASTSIGSFDRRCLGSVTANYDGIMGIGCDPVGGCPWYGSAVTSSVPSLSSTAVANSADELMVTEGGMWDLWMNVGVQNPFTYGVEWIPVSFAANGAGYSMAGSEARRNPLPQSPDGACTPSNSCDGFTNFGIQNGTSTMVATDGHAKASGYRGGIIQRGDIAGSTSVIKAFWPNGGY